MRQGFCERFALEAQLPLRVKIEVLIVKGNKVCLCEFKDLQDPKHKWFGFPGGGVEGDDTHEETAIKECLEEVGIRIKDVKPLGLTRVFPPLFNKVERNQQYSGVEKHFYYAYFDRIDTSIYNLDGDGVSYAWVILPLAATKVKDNGEHGQFRLEALQALDKILHHQS